MQLGYSRKNQAGIQDMEFPGVIDNFRVSNTIIDKIYVWTEDCKLDVGTR